MLCLSLQEISAFSTALLLASFSNRYDDVHTEEVLTQILIKMTP